MFDRRDKEDLRLIHYPSFTILFWELWGPEMFMYETSDDVIAALWGKDLSHCAVFKLRTLVPLDNNNLPDFKKKLDDIEVDLGWVEPKHDADKESKCQQS